MSGKRHHYLPQFLLRGFLSQHTKGKQRAFVFRKKIGLREANIKDIAVESRFYDHDNDSADDAITNAESVYAEAINAVRSNGYIPKETLRPLISFVDHLVVRTKHSREILNDSAQYMLDAAKGIFLSDENLDEMIDTALSDDRTHTELTREFMSLMPYADKRIVEQLIRNKLREVAPLIHSDLSALTRAFLPVVFSKTKDTVPNRVVEKQVGALKNGTRESNRLDDYLKLHWSISRYEPGALILGDIGPVGVSQKGEVVPPLMGGELHSIFLPISSDMLLTGSMEHVHLALSASELNALSSAMSLNLFVASNNSSDVVHCIKFFGTKSEEFYKDVIDKLSATPPRNA